MRDEPHRALKAIREELEQGLERRGWEFWPLTIEAEIIDDQYSVTLTKAGGTPAEVEVTDSFSRDTNSGKVAGAM